MDTWKVPKIEGAIASRAATAVAREAAVPSRWRATWARPCAPPVIRRLAAFLASLASRASTIVASSRVRSFEPRQKRAMVPMTEGELASPRASTLFTCVATAPSTTSTSSAAASPLANSNGSEAATPPFSTICRQLRASTAMQLIKCNAPIWTAELVSLSRSAARGAAAFASVNFACARPSDAIAWSTRSACSCTSSLRLSSSPTHGATPARMTAARPWGSLTSWPRALTATSVRGVPVVCSASMSTSVPRALATAAVCGGIARHAKSMAASLVAEAAVPDLFATAISAATPPPSTMARSASGRSAKCLKLLTAVCCSSRLPSSCRTNNSVAAGELASSLWTLSSPPLASLCNVEVAYSDASRESPSEVLPARYTSTERALVSAG